MNQDAGDLQTRIEALRNRDRPSSTFGGKMHAWPVQPPLSESAVRDFERLHGCVLPAAYRWFIIHLGNGGPGPGYGLASLQTDKSEPSRDLSRPFPHVDAVLRPHWRTLGRGVLPICDHGCGLGDFLVVTGAAAGQVWWDHCADGEGIGPYRDDSGVPLDFERYWLDWLRGLETQVERWYVLPARFASVEDGFSELVDRIRFGQLEGVRSVVEDLEGRLDRDALRDLVRTAVEGTRIEHGRVSPGPALNWRGSTISLGPDTAMALAHLNVLVPGLPDTQALAGSIRSLEVDDAGLAKLGRLDGLRTVTLIDRLGDDLIRDLGLLQQCPNLLNLTATGLDSLVSTAGVEHCTGLRSLNLQGCGALVTLAGVETLTELESIDVHGCTQVQSLAPLRSLPALARIDASQLRIASLGWVPSSMTALNVADGSELRSASELARAVGLENLSLSGCYHIEDFEFLTVLQDLRSLSLRETAFAQPADLVANPKLESLDLSWCEGVSDLSALADLKQLRVLRLAGLTVDAQLFLQLPALEILDLQNGSVKGLKALASHPALRTVRLEGARARKPKGWRF